MHNAQIGTNVTIFSQVQEFWSSSSGATTAHGNYRVHNNQNASTSKKKLLRKIDWNFFGGKGIFQVSLTYYFLMEASRALVNITHLCVSFRVTQRCTNAVTVLAYMISTKSISSATIPPWKQKFHLVLIIHSKWALLQKWVLSLIWSTISSL